MKLQIAKKVKFLSNKTLFFFYAFFLSQNIYFNFFILLAPMLGNPADWFQHASNTLSIANLFPDTNSRTELIFHANGKSQVRSNLIKFNEIVKL